MKKENKNLILIDDVKVWDKNPREISSKDFESLKKKIERWGIWKPFLVWESKKQILGGNQRYKACKELGHKEIWVEYREPKDDAEALEMAIADNESSGEWIKSLLIEQIKLSEDKINLEDYKINIKDTTLKDLMPIDTEEDNPPDEADIQSVSVLDDLYELGNHRVLCGDSTSVDNVEKLMDGKKADMVFTDPPYNVDYEGKTDDALKIKNDKFKNADVFYQFLLDAFGGMNIYSKEGASVYICHADLEGLNFRLAFRDAGYEIKQCLIWNKNTMVMGRQDYQWKHEPILYGWKSGASHQFYGGRNSYTVWDIAKPSRSAEHPTMKPLELIIKAIKNSSKGEDIILDTFLGSGSTLIACEKTERICYGMELDTHYTDVIVARYIKYMQDNNKSFTIKRNGEEIDYNLFLKDGK